MKIAKSVKIKESRWAPQALWRGGGLKTAL